LGARGRIIVDRTHRLVVERFFPKFYFKAYLNSNNDILSGKTSLQVNHKISLILLFLERSNSSEFNMVFLDNSPNAGLILTNKVDYVTNRGQFVIANPVYDLRL
jgi:hypothetical protein